MRGFFLYLNHYYCKLESQGGFVKFEEKEIRTRLKY
jgi:hypothetical protein